MTSPLLLAVDPSSTCTGWALLDSDDALIAWGTIRPPARLDPWERIDLMADAIADRIDLHQPDHAVIEAPSGKVAARTARYGGAGIAIYGEAVGVIRERIRRCGVPVDRVTEREWSNGVPKAKRATLIGLRFDE